MSENKKAFCNCEKLQIWHHKKNAIYTYFFNWKKFFKPQWYENILSAKNTMEKPGFKRGHPKKYVDKCLKWLST